ncbi:hypothetical protein SAMN05444354_115157 [Stigmatella aurantiaca]|uniref:Uncharacterized protein n=1 Tax=Stigmatella aurantiaca TaxID=41 RepID=A0A1H7XSW3_STIAU|nr:hypothetical protein [Stigmatella aurantiaca]SEM36870.1 hypothetical protein SAMN05444354_115157 [Stigmatella aurantiaca]
MIYALSADTSHIQEEESPEILYDAVLIEFEGFEDARFFRPDMDYHGREGVPEVIEFVGKLENVASLDHIGTSPMGFLILSKRMVRVLESVRPFPCRLIPTVIYSERIKHLVQDPDTGRRTWYQVQDPALRNDGFVILQVLSPVDCLDREATLVQGVPFSQSGKKHLGRGAAGHLALREPEGGFPPVFFVPELLYYCFSEEAKRACDAAGLKGLWWRPQR